MTTTIADTRTTTTQPDLVEVHYEPLVDPTRRAFVSSTTFKRLTDPKTHPELLDRFLIEFCALGVQMTQPVDGWITRAGRRCVATGLDELGAALQRHAVHEAGHHEMMIADTHALIARRNATGAPALDADALLQRPATSGVDAYIALHEATIASSAPYGQLAIEFEIERLSITAGPRLLGNIADVCGVDRIEMLSFLTDHVAVDAAHTVFNRRQLNVLLGEHPEFAESLGRAGSAALDAYLLFLGDCLAAAERS